ELYRESLSLLQPTGNRLNLYWTLSGIGILAMGQKDFGRARAAFQECLSLLREDRILYNVGSTFGWLGNLERLAGDFEAAEEYLTKGLRVQQTTGANARGWWALLQPFGMLLLQRGFYTHGVRLA